MRFFKLYPKITYNITNAPLAPETTITDVLFRVNYIKEVLNNVAAYTHYTITDSDTPELLAYRFYSDIEAHWMILYANDILDPINEWPKDYNTFNKMIISKYGSIEAAQTDIHHYEMVITRQNVPEQVTTESRYIISQEKLTDNDLDVPFDYYEGAGSLEFTAGEEVFEVQSKDVIVTKSRASISNYDYEYELNENRRKIKVIKKEFYSNIRNDFERLARPLTSRVPKKMRLRTNGQ